MKNAQRVGIRRDAPKEAHLTNHLVKTLENEVLVRIDRFALTTNNVTYAILGDAYQYWEFFPSHEEGVGIVPVWGVGTIIASEMPNVPVGRRFYGYWPMATHAVLRPERSSHEGFLDRSTARLGRPDLYQRYHALQDDPLHDEATTDLELLLRPLYTTAWLLADQLMDASLPNAPNTVVVSSASSKTSQALAHALAQTDQRPRVVGLTSRANLEVVRSSGVFHEAIAYEHVVESLAHLAGAGPIAYCDVAGNRGLRVDVHTVLGDALQHSIAVGVAHSDQLGRPERPLPGPKTSVFFVPNRVDVRVKEWGQDAFSRRLATAFRAYLTWADEHLRVRELTGLRAAIDAWHMLWSGDIDPTEGLIVLP